MPESTSAESRPPVFSEIGKYIPVTVDDAVDADIQKTAQDEEASSEKPPGVIPMDEYKRRLRSMISPMAPKKKVIANVLAQMIQKNIRGFMVKDWIRYTNGTKAAAGKDIQVMRQLGLIVNDNPAMHESYYRLTCFEEMTEQPLPKKQQSSIAAVQTAVKQSPNYLNERIIDSIQHMMADGITKFTAREWAHYHPSTSKTTGCRDLQVAVYKGFLSMHNGEYTIVGTKETAFNFDLMTENQVRLATSVLKKYGTDRFTAREMASATGLNMSTMSYHTFNLYAQGVIEPVSKVHNTDMYRFTPRYLAYREEHPAEMDGLEQVTEMAL